MLSENTTHKIIPVILAGGVGSRLWPLSRQAHPKPFIKLDDNQSLIQKTYARVTCIDGVEEILTVTNRELFFYTKDEYEALESHKVFNSFILEPFGRNSAAAIALAAHYANDKYGDKCTLLILPADHLIEKQDAFMKAIEQAMALSQTGKLVTFGIKPSSPQTGYGYIEAKESQVLRFVEKPDRQTAQQYLEAGTFFWNSGIFCMGCNTILKEMGTHCSSIAQQTKSCLATAKKSENAGWSQIEISGAAFESVDDISIDYALFEKSDNVSIVPCDIGWSDIGSWIEFGQLHPKDEQGNHILGETVLEETKNCIIHSENRLVAGVGLEDLIISDTQDALLIAKKDRAQDVKKIVKTLKTNAHEAYQFFPTVYRPWGNYTVLQEGNGFKIKRIEVIPGAELSLQSHRHRSEHWVVVSGVALVVNGEQTLTLEHNQSTYIPVGNKHRLSNPEKELLTIIEVQCGDYLGEDDIIRYDDVYGRQ